MCVHVLSCSIGSYSFVMLWTIALQVPLSIGQEFPRQEYWSGFPFSPPGDLPNPETEPMSSALAGGFFTTEPHGKARPFINICKMDLHFKKVCVAAYPNDSNVIGWKQC